MLTLPAPISDQVRARIKRNSIATWPTIFAALVIVGLIAMSLAVTAATGAVPQNDDWSYVKSALTLARTGEFELHIGPRCSCSARW